MKAPQFLAAGIEHMQNRATRYDKPEGERSMAKTAQMFTILHGEEIARTGTVTEVQGWDLMELLKMVRSSQGEFHADNYEDRAAYAGLAGEAAFKAHTATQAKVVAITSAMKKAAAPASKPSKAKTAPRRRSR
ncbi:DUF6378 domain-containing protein [Permianibacter fluminis]|uniref:DUF6378 domain-containing protein n=1 Tax=Permianibacter fluminis TaxID=2738515 RepID=UPI001B7D8DEC|nr:DUF6378 domain-containing protein [Permianibacter fluminis]